MSARHAYEARCWEALARHGHAITEGTPPRLADTQLIDALLKAWDRTIQAATTTAVTQHQHAEPHAAHA